jgi:hypothetical protein
MRILKMIFNQNFVLVTASLILGNALADVNNNNYFELESFEITDFNNENYPAYT